MSFTYSRALEVGFLQDASSGIAAYVRLSNLPMQERFLWLGRTTEASRLSLFGTMSEPLMDAYGAALLTWYLAGFPAKPTAAHLEDARWRTISGRRCDGSWQMSLPGSYSPRTPQDARSTAPPTTSKRWVTKSDALSFQRRTWVRTTFGEGTGYLHTPTHTANYSCASMQKWPNCREFVRVFGKPSPTNHEWLMGWPIGFTDLKPLATGKYQSWLQQHFASSPPSSPTRGEAAIQAERRERAL